MGKTKTDSTSDMVSVELPHWEATVFADVFGRWEMGTSAIEREPAVGLFANTIVLVVAFLYSLKQQLKAPWTPSSHQLPHELFAHTMITVLFFGI